MKQVTTNMSLGQIFFVICTILTFAGVGFYLGAKFGPRVWQWSESKNPQAAFLPDDALMTEVKNKLAETDVDYSFFEVLQNKKNQTVYALHDSKIPVVELPTPVAAAADTHLALADDLGDAPSLSEKVAELESSTKSNKTNDKPAVVAAPEVKPADKPSDKANEKPAVEKPAVKPATEKSVAEKPALTALDSKKKPADAAKTEEKPKVSEMGQEITQTKYLLQTGSYDSLKKAEKAKLVWAKRGYNAQIVLAQVGGKQWYRLRLGLYDDYSTIQNHQKNIRNSYNETAMILPIQ